MKEVFLTPEGREKLQEELDFLINVRRPEVAQRIKEAKEEGDVSENAGYDEAKTQQGFLEGRIQELEHVLKIAKVIDAPASADRVQLGSTVTVSEDGDGDEETFKIVGSAEADPGGALSLTSRPWASHCSTRGSGPGCRSRRRAGFSSSKSWPFAKSGAGPRRPAMLSYLSQARATPWPVFVPAPRTFCHDSYHR